MHGFRTTIFKIMKYTTDQLLQALPFTIPFRAGKESYNAGLVLHYSFTNRWWRAGYGKVHGAHAYCGQTPEEALYFLYKNMIKNKNHKHSVKELI